MDIIDGKILEMLAANANATTTEISAAINLSVPAVNKRIQKLQREGVIRSFTVLTDGVRVGKPITAFIFLATARAWRRCRLTWSAIRIYWNAMPLPVSTIISSRSALRTWPPWKISCCS